MHLMKTMFLTVFFVLSSLAQATESVRDSASALQTSMTSQSASEYLYIPAPGTGRFQLAPKIESRQYELKGDFSGMKKTREYKSQIIQLAYDHAFQQAGLSLGVETGFGSA